MDVHSHALEGLRRAELRDGRPLLAQGVTTDRRQPGRRRRRPISKRQRQELEAEGGVGVNVALLIGHASVRNAAMGEQRRRDPTAAELEQMMALVRQAVADGAFGLSSGLFYTPGRFSKTEEVIALARAAGGVYSSHIRDEGDYDYGVIASVDEVIRIAEEARVRGVVSHVKALGPDNWGKSKTIVEHIDAARARGVEVYADQYPYEASSTSICRRRRCRRRGHAGVKEAMASEECGRRFLALVRENIRRRGGAQLDRHRVGSRRSGSERPATSKTSPGRGGIAAEQAAVDIVLAGGASIVSFNMSEPDIEMLMKPVLDDGVERWGIEPSRSVASASARKRRIRPPAGLLRARAGRAAA